MENNQDFMKIMEQAGTLSQMMGMEPEKTEQVFQMLQLAHLFGHSKTEPAAEPEPAEPEPERQPDPEPSPPIAEEPESFSGRSEFYDDPINTPDLKAMKAALPFVENRYQRGIGIWIKLIEIQRLLEMYAGMTASAMRSSRRESDDWRLGMLQAVRPHMSKEKQITIDFLMKLIDMKEIMTKMEEYRNGNKS